MKIQTKTQYILPGEQVAAVPLGNFDVFEDESTLVGCTTLYQLLKKGCSIATSIMRKTPSAKA